MPRQPAIPCQRCSPMVRSAASLGPQGERLLPLEQFFRGSWAHGPAAGGAAGGLRLPPPLPRSGALYIKHSPRSTMDIATVGVASVVSLAAQPGVCQEVKITLGAVAPTVVRATAAEALCAGSPWMPSVCSRPRRPPCRPPARWTTSVAPPPIGVRSLPRSCSAPCSMRCRWRRAPCLSMQRGLAVEAVSKCVVSP